MTISAPPEQGQFVNVRQRQWVVSDVARSTLPDIHVLTPHFEHELFLGASPNTMCAWGADGEFLSAHPLNNYPLYKGSGLEKVLRRLLKPVPVTARPRKSR